MALCQTSITEIQLQRRHVLPIRRELQQCGGRLAVLVAGAAEEEEVRLGFAIRVCEMALCGCKEKSRYLSQVTVPSDLLLR